MEGIEVMAEGAPIQKELDALCDKAAAWRGEREMRRPDDLVERPEHGVSETPRADATTQAAPIQVSRVHSPLIETSEKPERAGAVG